MILSDRDLRKAIKERRLVITPFTPSMVQPSSIDLHVDSKFRVFANTRYPYIDVKKKMEDLTELVEVAPDQPFILHPGEFVLGSTLEHVRLSDDLVSRLEGKSSLGRLGLLIHSSLPASESVVIGREQEAHAYPIREVVRHRLRGPAVSFNPTSMEVAHHEITGWYEGPPDRIFEVTLRCGRQIHVTGGHNLFTIGADGKPSKTRTLELAPGIPIAIPNREPHELNGISLELRWDEIRRVRDTGTVEPIYDIEVRPNGRHIENYTAGDGVFASNTAGFVDAGWSGHLTLELSNVSNLPITIYPGMKIGQLCVFQMSSPAERSYAKTGKYQGQRGPTPSKFYMDFAETRAALARARRAASKRKRRKRR